jgi:hypothetical protein
MSKKLLGNLDGTPSKRIYQSIKSDYDIIRSVCELIDNAIDIWTSDRKQKNLTIKIKTNLEQQTVSVSDNAGGVPKSRLTYLVSPGMTGNMPDEEIIGIFGVGTKRAVVALSQDIKIFTRNKDKTYLIEIDDNWLANPSWNIPHYEVNEICCEGETIIELQKLRFSLTNEIISNLEEQLMAVYGKFLKNSNLQIYVNNTKLSPKTFDEAWSYPPEYPPKMLNRIIKTDEGDVRVKITAGLALDTEPDPAGEYGVYIYCNDRLICRALKSHEVGFARRIVGAPHYEISLVRVIVEISGKAKLMPWNSSKSDIKYHDKVFEDIRQDIIEFAKYFASLSRRWKGEWDQKVYPYNKGEFEESKAEIASEALRLYAAPLPPSKLRYDQKLQEINRSILKKKTWVRGLHDAICAVDLILNKNYEFGYRIALILLDNTLEIAFKEYLLFEVEEKYSANRIHNIMINRTQVHEEIQKQGLKISKSDLKKIEFYYDLRCKLTHEKASVTITGNQIEEYDSIVKKMLNRMFHLQFNTEE